LQRVFLARYDLSLHLTFAIAANRGMARVVELLMSKSSVACNLALDQSETPNMIFVLRTPTVDCAIAALGPSRGFVAIQKETGIGKEVIGVLLKMSVVGARVHQVA
jgi:hypothetical protein